MSYPTLKDVRSGPPLPLDLPLSSIEYHRNADETRHLNQYTLLQKLGTGQFGTVYKAQYNTKFYAIKDLPKRPTTKTVGSRMLMMKDDEHMYINLAKIKREIDILHKLRFCEGIVKMIEVLDSPNFKQVFIVQEFYPSELKWTSGIKRYSNDDIRRFAKGLVTGLYWLQQHHVVHRDLKPSNLLLDRNGNIRICDFGVSCVVDELKDPQKELSKIVGTPAFIPPELCDFVSDEPKQIEPYKIDIWSFGVTIYCLQYGSLPWEGTNEFDMYKKIVSERLVLEGGGACASMVKNCLVKDPKKRYSVAELMRCEFIQMNPPQSPSTTFLDRVKKKFPWKTKSEAQTRAPSNSTSSRFPVKDSLFDNAATAKHARKVSLSKASMDVHQLFDLQDQAFKEKMLNGAGPTMGSKNGLLLSSRPLSTEEILLGDDSILRDDSIIEGEYALNDVPDASEYTTEHSLLNHVANNTERPLTNANSNGKIHDHEHPLYDYTYQSIGETESIRSSEIEDNNHIGILHDDFDVHSDHSGHGLSLEFTRSRKSHPGSMLDQSAAPSTEDWVNITEADLLRFQEIRDYLSYGL